MHKLLLFNMVTQSPKLVGSKHKNKMLTSLQNFLESVHQMLLS